MSTSTPAKDEAMSRVWLDIQEIWLRHDRTGELAKRNLRWEGTDNNPNGWRTMAYLANDLELILEPEREINERRQRNGAGKSGTHQEHGDQQAPGS